METFSSPAMPLLTTSIATTHAITSGNATANAPSSVPANSSANNVNSTRQLPQGVLLLAMYYYIVFVI